MEKSPENKRKYYPLTHAQKRIYYDDKMYQGASVSTQAFLVRYSRLLDRSLLEKAVNKVIRKNEGFRLRIVEIEYEPLQYVSECRERTLDYFDFSGPGGEQRLKEWVEKTARTPLEVGDDDLFYFALLKYSKKESGYYMGFHHAVSDGGSYPLVFSEINKIYEALERGETVDDTLNPSYLEYIADEKAYLDSPQVEKDKEYWHKHLEPLPSSLNLTPKKGAAGDIIGKMYVDIFPGSLRKLMEVYAKSTRTSFFKQFISAVSLYAAKVSGVTDISIGAVNHNRAGGNRDNVVGMFVSTFPIRVKLEGGITFNDFTGKTGKHINYILKNHQQYPFDRLAAEMRETAGVDIGYLLDIFISAHGDVEKENYTFEHIFQGYVPGSLNIHINYNNKYLDGVLELEYEYRVSHYSEADVRRIHRGLVNVLSHALSDPGKKISQLEVVSEEEKKQILYDFNDTVCEYTFKDKTLHVFFEEQVGRMPENTALLYGDEKISYLRLNQKANRAARVLRKKGLNTGDIVGIAAERSPRLIIGVMAILKAGGAFLPIAPGTTMEKSGELLKQAGCKLFLSGNDVEAPASFEGEMIALEDKSLYQADQNNLEGAASPLHLACTIYVADGKGESVGVLLEHASLVDSLFSLQRMYPIEKSDISLLRTSCRSEIFLAELFGWFLGGGCLSIFPESGVETPPGLLEKIAADNITHLHLPPTLFLQLVNISDKQSIKKLSALKYLFLSGEIILPGLLRRFRALDSNISVVNLFGKVEMSVFGTSYSVADWDGEGRIPIGTPLGNVNVFIANNVDGTPVLLPLGAPGELCVAGPGLARGYVAPDDGTGVFINNPFVSGKGEEQHYQRLYRTGELACRFPDGRIEYLGRVDRQVKINGTRMYRDELEDLLLGLEGENILEAVATIREDEKGIYPCAYVVSGDNVDTARVRKRLAEIFPMHLVPYYIMQIDSIPVTADGRTDRSELLDFKHDPHRIEDILAEIEAEVLRMKKDEIELDDNFFDLGGHSFKAAQVASKIHKALNVKVSMTEIFKRPTLRQLSEYLTESIEVKYQVIQPTALREYYPQSPVQRRLYFLHQMEENNTAYNIQMMDIYCKGFEKNKLEDAFRALIKRHESLRTSFHIINDGDAVQKIHDYSEIASEFAIEYYETDEEGEIYTWDPGKNSAGEQMEGRSFQEVIQGFVRPFELDKSPLIRVGFLKIMHNTKILMLDMHHIIADGISLEILAKELWELYDGKELSPLRIQYKDFSEWLNAENQVEAVKEQETFWLKEFEGEIPLLNLPTDFPRPGKLTFDGDTVDFLLGGDETRRLNQIAKDHGESLYMVLFSAFNTLLARITGQEDIVVGTVTAGRGHEDLRNIVGMFLNTLAIRSYPQGNKVFDDFLTEIKLTVFAAFENQDYPFDELARKVAPRVDASRNPLFDVVFGLENEADPTGYLMEVAIPDKTKPYNFENKKAKFDMTLICVESDEGTECSIEYKTKLFRRETIERFASYFKKLVISICSNVEYQLSRIDILPEAEREKILSEFNNTAVDYPSDKTIHELVEEHAAGNPENPAVIMGDERLTYRQFNEMCNRLAVVLREKGVKPNSIVALMTGRTRELPIAQLGILKAGGAYLSVDIELPEARKKFLLEDSSADFLLVRKEYLETHKDELNGFFKGEVIPIDDQSFYKGVKDFSNLENVTGPDDLAYVIYTSGTTGKPKGVMMHHRGIASLNVCTRERFHLSRSSRVLQFATVSFDASVWEVWMAFLNGGALVLIETDIIQNYEVFIEYMNNTGVTITLLPPMYVNHIDPESVKTLKTLLTGGAAAGSEMVEKWRRHLRYVNCYGPTEASICCTMWKAPKEGEPVVNPPIGLPVYNTKIHIVDKNMDLVPVGISGELCVSGIHVAKGYLNRPELTHEKFVEDSILPGNRLYKTGDLVRWLPDGNIEYSGRIDFQVKIRGFRIEPGEVENCIARYEKIKDAAVLALNNKVSGEKFLCAYIVPHEQFALVELKGYLHEELPDYMVPSHFVQVEQIPLTASGKVDKRALPEPSAETPEDEYEAPRNEMEERLAEVWQQVLGVEKAGVNNDFFSLGGDSIKAIQIVSRLQKSKLKLEVSQFFIHKTIGELALHVTSMAGDAGEVRAIDQDTVEGTVKLTPIQRWFFRDHLSYCHHFNQSITLSRKAGFDASYIEKIFTRIVSHHDALRMVYKFEDDTVIQENRGIEGELFELKVMNLEVKKAEAVIEQETIRLQKEINLSAGPLVKLILFKGAEDAGDHLFVTIHHMVVDGVSWRILLEDFETAYQQLEEGKEIAFQEKTDSFKRWARELSEYAENYHLLSQVPYWTAVEGMAAPPIPVDTEIGDRARKFGETDIIPIQLSGKETLRLLTKVNWAYNTEINDILLAALALTFRQWAGLEKVLVNLEAHGREDVIKNIDINRTVGWFTTQYPVLLDVPPEEDISFIIKGVKETLRRVPYKGIGHGILKYLTPQKSVENLHFKHVPEIVFNYLGRFGGERFTVIDELSGLTDLISIKDSFSPDFEMSHKIDIEGVTDGDILKLFFFYHPGEYKKDTVQKLAEMYKSNLLKIIGHCAGKEQRELTPSDFGCKELPIRSLETIVDGLAARVGKDAEIEMIYALTAMQEEMSRSTVANKEAYFVQNMFSIPSNTDTVLLQQSFIQLIERFAVLRSVFIPEKSVGPLQVVLKDRELDIEVINIGHLTQDERQRRLEQIKEGDKRTGFDLTTDIPMKVIRVNTGDSFDTLVWSIHHIVIDGWCLGVVVTDLLDIYDALVKESKVALPPVIPYKNYIQWLDDVEMEEGFEFQDDYLRDLRPAITLSALGKKVKQGEYKLEEYYFTFDEGKTEALNRAASENYVTLNTLFQVIWGVLLQYYLKADDVLFGSIVAGRSSKLEGIENIVGLFINIIPVRIRNMGVTSLAELLQRTQQQLGQAKRYEYLPLADILSRSSLDNMLDTLMFFENYPLEEEDRNMFSGRGEDGLKIRWSGNHEQIDYSMNVYVIPGKTMTVRFSYNGLVYDGAFIKRFASNFQEIAKQVVEKPALDLGDISIEE